MMSEFEKLKTETVTHNLGYSCHFLVGTDESHEKIDLDSQSPGFLNPECRI